MARGLPHQGISRFSAFSCPGIRRQYPADKHARGFAGVLHNSEVTYLTFHPSSSMIRKDDKVVPIVQCHK